MTAAAAAAAEGSSRAALATGAVVDDDDASRRTASAAASTITVALLAMEWNGWSSVFDFRTGESWGAGDGAETVGDWTGGLASPAPGISRPCQERLRLRGGARNGNVSRGGGALMRGLP